MLRKSRCCITPGFLIIQTSEADSNGLVVSARSHGVWYVANRNEFCSDKIYVFLETGVIRLEMIGVVYCSNYAQPNHHKLLRKWHAYDMKERWWYSLSLSLWTRLQIDR